MVNNQINKKKLDFILKNVRKNGRICVINDMGEIMDGLPNSFEKYSYGLGYFNDGFFKYIISNEAIGSVIINQYLLSDLKRILNRKGRMIIIEKNKNRLINNEWVDVKDFTKRLEKIFRKVERYYLGIPYFSKYVGWVCKK